MKDDRRDAGGRASSGTNAEAGGVGNEPPNAAVWWRRDGADIVLQVLVQPRASREAFAGIVGDRIKISLTSPPVEGAANEALRAFLAKQFGVPKSRVELESGETGRRKRVRLRSVALLPPGLAQFDAGGGKNQR